MKEQLAVVISTTRAKSSSLAQTQFHRSRVRQEPARTAIRGIGTAYHPVDLKTGAPRTTAQVTADLEQHFGEIGTVAMVEAAQYPTDRRP